MNSYDELNKLNTILANRFDEVLEWFELNNIKSGINYYYGPCPVHSGDNNGAFNCITSGDFLAGHWRCYTHTCEKIFCKTLIGFVRGMLSSTKLDWKKTDDIIYPFKQTLDFIYDKLGIKRESIQTIQLAPIKKKQQVVNQFKVPRNDVRSRLIIPANYYLNRGYSKDILSKYDIGFCNDFKKPFYKRVVVPIYDQKNEYALAFTGRSIYEKCTTCSSYHSQEKQCPEERIRWCYSKWKNHGNTAPFLYNFWNASKEIRDKKTIVLVEGPGDVWRLEEAGIHNSVALLGNKITQPQQILLQSIPNTRIILLLDNDEAGKTGKNEIMKILSKTHNTISPSLLTNKDIGDMSVQEVKTTIQPYLESI